jgi:hypothetical protein
LCLCLQHRSEYCNQHIIHSAVRGPHSQFLRAICLRLHMTISIDPHKTHTIGRLLDLRYSNFKQHGIIIIIIIITHIPQHTVCASQRHTIHLIQCVRKVAVHLQKVLQVMSTNVYTCLNPFKQLHTLPVLHLNRCLTTEYSETTAHFNGNFDTDNQIYVPWPKCTATFRTHFTTHSRLCLLHSYIAHRPKLRSNSKSCNSDNMISNPGVCDE